MAEARGPLSAKQCRGLAFQWVFLPGSLLAHAPPPSPALAEAYIPPQVFYNGKVDYFDLQRLGGLLSHLRKTLKGACRPVGGGQDRRGLAGGVGGEAVPQPTWPGVLG